MKPTPMEPELLAQLRAKTAEADCPECGAQALEIVERYDPTRAEPQIPGLAYGPKGRPLWAWCGQCGAHGRVAEFRKSTGARNDTRGT